jgi:hypothetical protein
MKYIDLNEDNIILYAAKHYDNHCCTNITEFYEDLGTTVLIKKLLTKYENSGVLKDRLVINHLISFFNVFDFEPCIRILFYKIDKKYHSLLKSLLKFVDRCPEDLYLNSKIYLCNIQYDEKFLKYLDRTYA